MAVNPTARMSQSGRPPSDDLLSEHAHKRLFMGTFNKCLQKRRGARESIARGGQFLVCLPLLLLPERVNEIGTTLFKSLESNRGC
jgi:hypothetical protein